jgi:hypothetical protein
LNVRLTKTSDEGQREGAMFKEIWRAILTVVFILVVIPILFYALLQFGDFNSEGGAGGGDRPTQSP